MLNQILYVNLTKEALYENEFMLHSCDNPNCCNVIYHIRKGTHQENMKDMISRNRQSKGSLRYNSIFNEDKIFEMCEKIMNNEFSSYLEIANYYNVNRNLIATIFKNSIKNWNWKIQEFCNKNKITFDELKEKCKGKIKNIDYNNIEIIFNSIIKNNYNSIHECSLDLNIPAYKLQHLLKNNLYKKEIEKYCKENNIGLQDIRKCIKSLK
jgi:hypothetical protein